MFQDLNPETIVRASSRHGLLDARTSFQDHNPDVKLSFKITKFQDYNPEDIARVSGRQGSLDA